jgi:hypothetical protein
MLRLTASHPSRGHNLVFVCTIKVLSLCGCPLRQDVCWATYEIAPAIYILSRGWVTIDGVWIGDSIYWPFIHLRLVTTLYRSLTHIDQCPQSIRVSTGHFLATDFSTGTIIISLNYILQISHIESSLQGRTFNWALLQLTRGHFTSTSLSSLHRLTINWLSQNQNQNYVTTDGQSASLSWCQAPIWDLRPDFFCLTVAGLLTWGALCDERTGLSFTMYEPVGCNISARTT